MRRHASSSLLMTWLCVGFAICAMPYACADDMTSWQQQSLARPLFSPSRRPALSKAALSGTPRLSAIIDHNGHGSAIFMIPGRERGLIVPVGGTVGTWHLKAIAGNSVTIIENGRDRILRPDRDRHASQSVSSSPTENNLAPTDSSGFAPPASSDPAPFDNAPSGMPQ
ncbi:hypothetical protein [Asaia lannensis]|uniref:hypothetical protein n=1 Tax=Asaia lannensis TaxID=415421 RepID=UPI001C999E7D